MTQRNVELLDCLNAADASYLNNVEVLSSRWRQETNDIEIRLANEDMGLAPMQQVTLGVPQPGCVSAQVHTLPFNPDYPLMPVTIQFVKYRPLLPQDIVQPASDVLDAQETEHQARTIIVTFPQDTVENVQQVADDIQEMLSLGQYDADVTVPDAELEAHIRVSLGVEDPLEEPQDS